MTPHPNVLGGYLSMCVLVCLGALRTHAERWRTWLWVALAAGTLGLFCSFSRSAWLATAIGVVYLVVVTRQAPALAEQLRARALRVDVLAEQPGSSAARLVVHLNDDSGTEIIVETALGADAPVIELVSLDAC